MGNKSEQGDFEQPNPNNEDYPNDDEARMHNIVKVEFWIDCGNCTMNKVEAGWFERKINALCEQRNTNLKQIFIYD